jgi:thioredoxin 1
MAQQSVTGRLITVTDDDFADAVLTADHALVDFWAEWCPPCHAIAPVLADLAEEFHARLVVAKLNVDENPVATQTYGVRSMPTLLLFRSGEVVGTIIGARPRSALRQAILAPLDA